MQPYFFPYLGYFQLMHAVDVFVVLDDVAFIKQGWINRNFLLMDCRALRFTVPLTDASSFRSIYATRLANVHWQSRFLKSVKQAYAKASQFAAVYPLVEAVVQQEWRSIADLALSSLRAATEYLGLKTAIRPTSRVYNNSHLKGQERVLDICLQEKADTYVNAMGGRALYDREVFCARGVELLFIKMENVHYRQFGCEFVPNLSILDVLMFNEPERVRELLHCYSMEH